jgi:cell wall-associated NlpC family hydrolase
MRFARVSVDVATVWVDPSSPRDIDRPAVANPPDHATWSTLDAEARFGLHDRTETQLLEGEPVHVLTQLDGWTRIAAPWQPSPKDPRGYPGWVRTAHLTSADEDDVEPMPPVATMEADHGGILELARTFMGVPYLWGGTSPWGFDCSGVIHYCYRRAGIVVPRDANAQEDASEPIPLGSERPGDLYFFAHPGRTAHHIGFVTGHLTMLHAPEDGASIEEVSLPPTRMELLTGAGRIRL